jgi:hypothetical protein
MKPGSYIFLCKVLIEETTLLANTSHQRPNPPSQTRMRASLALETEEASHSESEVG